MCPRKARARAPPGRNWLSQGPRLTSSAVSSSGRIAQDAEVVGQRPEAPRYKVEDNKSARSYEDGQAAPLPQQQAQLAATTAAAGTARTERSVTVDGVPRGEPMRAKRARAQHAVVEQRAVERRRTAGGGPSSSSSPIALPSDAEVWHVIGGSVTAKRTLDELASEEDGQDGKCMRGPGAQDAPT